MITNGDRERRIFLSHPQKNNEFFFFLLTTRYLICYWEKKHEKRLPGNPEYAEMRHADVILILCTMTSRIDVRPACSCSSFPRAGTGVRYIYICVN